jgi:hypothetical protein
LLLTGVIQLVLLVVIGAVVLFIPLYLIGELPLPPQPRLDIYMYGVLAGGLLSIPIRRYLVRRLERRAV